MGEGADVELEDTVLSSVASLYRAMFASAQGAAALSADTSPSCAEEASPIAKHLVLHGSHTILFLNRSSIFQEEMAEPRADAALVPHPCRTGPAQTPPLTQLLNDGLRTRKLSERGAIPPPLQFEVAGCFPSLRRENCSAEDTLVLIFQRHTFLQGLYYNKLLS